ncbi:hypothetical protein [Gordonia soli]|uniref:Uncharacterized protein n=1 Tax=Gordonia soli NBRC 108243 TaxID=1223545 RepID=M0QNQ4_9ACTN|nr:hypothetical protein GS4_31_00050 [Gordonia soli NBRC 108243]
MNSIAPNSTITLSDLTSATGLEVFDYLDQSVTIPIVDGVQAQGDLLVVPRSVIADDIVVSPRPRRVPVPASGIELLRSAAGGNPHTLVAEAGMCTWATTIRDEKGLALGLLRTDVTAYLIHPEHGATGIAPGEYVIRRQREAGGLFGRVHLIAD